MSPCPHRSHLRFTKRQSSSREPPPQNRRNAVEFPVHCVLRQQFQSMRTRELHLPGICINRNAEHCMQIMWVHIDFHHSQTRNNRPTRGAKGVASCGCRLRQRQRHTLLASLCAQSKIDKSCSFFQCHAATGFRSSAWRALILFVACGFCGVFHLLQVEGIPNEHHVGMLMAFSMFTIQFVIRFERHGGKKKNHEQKHNVCLKR